MADFLHKSIPEGIELYDVNTNKTYLLDCRWFALLGYSIQSSNDFTSIKQAEINYSPYISWDTRKFFNNYCIDTTRVLKDSENILRYDNEYYRRWLVDKGVSYSADELVAPNILNDLTNKACAYAFIKGFVLASMNEMTEQYHSQMSWVRIQVKTKPLCDSLVDYMKYFGILPPTYSANFYYDSKGYFIVIKEEIDPSQGINITQNDVDWFIDQSQGFRKEGLSDISNPRGNPEEEIVPPSGILPLVSGYMFDNSSGWAQNYEFIYDGKDHSFPTIIENPNETATPSLNNVNISYRLLDSSQWSLYPPKIKTVGTYICVARIESSTPDTFRPLTISMRVFVRQRKVLIQPEISSTFDYDGSVHYPLYAQANPVEGIPESGLSDDEYIYKPSLVFDPGFINPGTFQSFVKSAIICVPFYEFSEESGHDEIVGIKQDTTKNYDIIFVPGTIVIRQSSYPVPVEQAIPVVNVPIGIQDASLEPIVVGPRSVYFISIPIRPVEYKTTCNLHSLTLDIKESSAAMLYDITVWMLDENETAPVNDSPEKVLFSGSIQLNPGEQTIHFQTMFPFSDFFNKTLAVLIDNRSLNANLILGSKRFIQGTSIQKPMRNRSPQIETDVIPNIQLRYNEYNANSRVSSYIGGYNESVSTAYPIPSNLYLSSSSPSASPNGKAQWLIDFNKDCCFVGNKISAFRLKVASFENQNSETHPTTLTLTYLNQPDLDIDFTEVLDIYPVFGSVTITDNPSPWITIPCTLPGGVLTIEPEYKFVVSLKSTAGFVKIEQVSFETIDLEGKAVRSSSYAFGFAERGFSLSSLEAQFGNMTKQPVFAIEWGEEELVVAEPRSVTSSWLADMQRSNIDPLPSLQNNGVEITGLSSGGNNGQTWFVADDTPVSFQFNSEEVDLSNTRRVAVGFFAEINGDTPITLEIDMGALGIVPIVVSNDPRSNFKYFDVQLPGNQSGEDFEMTIEACPEPLFIRDITLVVFVVN